MECNKVRALLEEWLDGEVAGAEHAGMEQHLQDCAGCALYLAERRRLGMALKATLSEQTAQLRFQPPPQSRLAAAGRWSWPLFNIRALLAMAAMVLVVLLFVFQPWTRPRQGHVAERRPITVITIRDSLDDVDESFISGGINGFTYQIHMQVTDVRISGHS